VYTAIPIRRQSRRIIAAIINIHNITFVVVVVVIIVFVVVVVTVSSYPLH